MSEPAERLGFRAIDVQPLTPAVGAEVRGVDLARDLSDEEMDAIRGALAHYGVVFFRDQVLTPEQHIAFAERWGTIDVNRFFRPVAGYPQIAEVLKEPGQTDNIGNHWHTDHSYDAAPAMGSILYAREVPRTGGDTLFASMYHAYDTLSDGLKRALEGLRAVHSSRHVFGPDRYKTTDLGGRLGRSDLAVQDAVHPVVVRHPDSGRRTLYVNPDFTVRFDGWTEAESRPLLQSLYQHAIRAEFTCRFRWRAGSLAFWDNRAVWHYAVNDYHGERRLMHRVTVAGVPLG